MMLDTWQDWIILAAVLGAVGYLVYRYFIWLRNRRECANCGLMRMVREKNTNSSKPRTSD